MERGYLQQALAPGQDKAAESITITDKHSTAGQ